MKTKELDRFNRGNQLYRLIKYYQNNLDRFNRNPDTKYTIGIQESFGNQNKFSTQIRYDADCPIDDKIINQGIVKMYEHIINNLEAEFKKL